MDKKWSKILIIAKLDMPILTSIYFKFIEKGWSQQLPIKIKKETVPVLHNY